MYLIQPQNLCNRPYSLSWSSSNSTFVSSSGSEMMLKGLVVSSSSSMSFSSIFSLTSSLGIAVLYSMPGSSWYSLSSSSIDPPWSFGSVWSVESSYSYSILSSSCKWVYLIGLPLGSYLTTNDQSLSPGTFE